MRRKHFFLMMSLLVTGLILASAVAQGSDLDIVMKTASAEGDDPLETGRQAALTLKESLGSTSIHALILVDSFEDKEFKEKVVEGVASVFPKEKIFGGATYGIFTQEGSLDFDSDKFSCF